MMTEETKPDDTNGSDSSRCYTVFIEVCVAANGDDTLHIWFRSQVSSAFVPRVDDVVCLPWLQSRVEEVVVDIEKHEIDVNLKDLEFDSATEFQRWLKLCKAFRDARWVAVNFDCDLDDDSKYRKMAGYKSSSQNA